MVQGLWTVEFRSSLGLVGTGIVVFEDGRVMGGDGGHYYKGTYELSGDQITGKLKVTKFNPDYNSVLGPIDVLDLRASGSTSDDVMVLIASVDELPETRMSIVCTRREDL